MPEICIQKQLKRKADLILSFGICDSSCLVTLDRIRLERIRIEEETILINDEKRSKDRLKSYIKLLALSLRSSIWIGALLLSRVLKQCDSKIAEKKAEKATEGAITIREEKGEGKPRQTVGR